MDFNGIIERKNSTFVKGDVLSEHADLADWLKRDPARIVELPGAFWVAHRSEYETMLICSRNALEQGFYYADENGIHFGSTVLEVLRSAKLGWEWNWRALASMVYFGHPLRRDTLHARIRRLWAGDIVRWRAGKTELTTVSEPVAPNEPRPVEAAVDAILSFVRKHGNDKSVVPLSAGFDSRLILAAFLAAGIRPTLFVKGVNRQATDVRIAHQIAAALDLPIRYADLPWHDYVQYRDRIVELTSGTKTPDNWHTFVGTKRAGFNPDTVLFTGTNGEYARTLWADRGLVLLVAELLSRYSVPRFWDAKLNRIAGMPTVAEGMSREFSECLAGAREMFRNWLLENYGPPTSLAATNDEFFRRERIPAFHANGYALYTANCRVRTAFLSPEWYNAVRQMPRTMKLGSRWHRYAIGRLCPKLLDFPTNDSGVPMGANVPFTYWLGLSGYGAGATIPYGPEYLQSEDFFEMLAAALPHVADLFDARPTLDFVRKVRTLPGGQRSVSVIAALAFWMEAVHKNEHTASVSRLS
jgi:hypothetical protein